MLILWVPIWYNRPASATDSYRTLSSSLWNCKKERISLETECSYCELCYLRKIKTAIYYISWKFFFAFKIKELSFNRLVFYMREIVLDISISHVGVSSVSEKMFGRLDSSHIVSVNNIDFFFLLILHYKSRVAAIFCVITGFQWSWVSNDEEWK